MVWQISLFFRHVHPNIPLLLHSDFVVPNTPPASSPFTPSSVTSAGPPVDVPSSRPSILVYGIICISLRFSKNAHFASHGPTSKKHYHQVCRQRVIMQAMDKMNVQSLQALAILALDSMESGEGPSGWGGVLSLLTGGIRHGNLGEEEPIVKAIITSSSKPTTTKSSPNGKVYNPTNKTALFPTTENWMEVEERRRLFWRESDLVDRRSSLTWSYLTAVFLSAWPVVYVLDRYASVSTGWAFEYGDEDVQRRLPCRDDNWMAGAVSPADRIRRHGQVSIVRFWADRSRLYLAGSTADPVGDRSAAVAAVVAFDLIVRVPVLAHPPPRSGPRLHSQAARPVVDPRHPGVVRRVPRARRASARVVDVPARKGATCGPFLLFVSQDPSLILRAFSFLGIGQKTRAGGLARRGWRRCSEGSHRQSRTALEPGLPPETR